MSLYAIGDLHLHFAAELKSQSQLHGRAWKNHEAKFRKNCDKMVQPGIRRLSEMETRENTGLRQTYGIPDAQYSLS